VFITSKTDRNKVKGFQAKDRRTDHSNIKRGKWVDPKNLFGVREKGNLHLKSITEKEFL